MGGDQWAALGVIVGIVVAVVLARRAGRKRLTAALAQAHASGRAELTAELQQMVQVNVPVNFHQHASPGGASLGPAWTADDLDYEPPYDAGVLAAIAALDHRAAELDRARQHHPALDGPTVDDLGDAGRTGPYPRDLGGPAGVDDRGRRGWGRGPGD